MNPTAVPERVRWAVAVLDPHPGERVLDIGSGTGASVEALLVALRGPGSQGATDAAARASVVAIDRSGQAVGRMRERLADEVAAGAVDVVHAGLGALDPESGPFDAAVSVNVNVFWTSAAVPELRALAHVLRPGARLLVAYGIGPVPLADAGHLDGVAAAIRATPWFVVRERLEAEHGSGILAERSSVSASAGT